MAMPKAVTVAPLMMKRTSCASTVRRSGEIVESIGLLADLTFRAAACRFTFNGYSANCGRAQGCNDGGACLRLDRAQVEARCSSGLARFLRGLDLRALRRDPLVSARRYRRQYAHDAGARAAPWPRVVRPSPVQNEHALWCKHPLVAAGGPAHCGADPRAPALPGRTRCRALGRRHRAASAVSAPAVFRGADHAAADRPACISV